MDFNPFGKTTDSLLYSWDELNNDEFAKSTDSMSSSKLEFRIVEDNYGISSNQYSIYAQPKESIEAFLSGKQGEIEAEQLSNMIKEVSFNFIYDNDFLKINYAKNVHVSKIQCIF